MHRILAALAAATALTACPTLAGDTEIEAVNEALNHTPCLTLTRLVIDADPRTAHERQLRTAATGILVGRASAMGGIADLYPNIKAEQVRLAAGCDGRPKRTWISIILGAPRD